MRPRIALIDGGASPLLPTPSMAQPFLFAMQLRF